MIDSHAHLTSETLLPHIDPILERARQAGIARIVNICTDVKSLRAGLELAQRHPILFNAAATTPHDAEKEGATFFPDVEAAVPHLVALGETGLDYHYLHSSKEAQQALLLRYFALSRKTHLPLIFHCRDAFADLFSLATAHYPGGRGLLHCFTGSKEEALRAVDLGWFLSFSGILTFKKSEALRAVASCVPKERILVETDAPYLAPHSRRGALNEPAFLEETVATLAACLHISVEACRELTTANAETFFSFAKLNRKV